jgi:hypothetical protein
MCILSLRTSYRQHHEVLGETSHGLLHDNHEEKIEEGSVLANAWDMSFFQGKISLND